MYTSNVLLIAKLIVCMWIDGGIDGGANCECQKHVVQLYAKERKTYCQHLFDRNSENILFKKIFNENKFFLGL